jgi:formylglycine-generating enzyme required for sulfatase activity
VHASPTLCIDKTEVTVAAYSKCVDAQACTLASPTPTGNGAKDAVIAKLGPLCNANKKDRQRHPVNCIDWAQASAYCTWVNGRLPSEAEWELAARGDDARTYPWGDEPPTAKRVNACGPECAAMFKRTLGSKFAPMYTSTDGFEGTGPVGSFPAGASPAGALDMAGNVGEWVTDWFEVNKRRVFRGGGWDQTAPSGLAITRRDAAPPEIKSVIVGFRCAY